MSYETFDQMMREAQYAMNRAITKLETFPEQREAFEIRDRIWELRRFFDPTLTD